MNTVPVKSAWSLLVVSLLFSPPAFAASLERDAQQFLSQTIEAMFSKCGKSSFTRWYPSGYRSSSYIIVHIEALTTNLKPEALTAGDAHEGTEWEGIAVLRSAGRRQYPVGTFAQNSWGEWLRHRRSDPVMTIYKQHEQWHFSVPMPFGSYGLTSFELIECSEVPS